MLGYIVTSGQFFASFMFALIFGVVGLVIDLILSRGGGGGFVLWLDSFFFRLSLVKLILKF